MNRLEKTIRHHNIVLGGFMIMALCHVCQTGYTEVVAMVINLYWLSDPSSTEI